MLSEHIYSPDYENSLLPKKFYTLLVNYIVFLKNTCTV